jgi:hypothetical protein
MELIRKLRIDAAKQLWLINAPDSCCGLFNEFDIVTKPIARLQADQLLLFAHDSDELKHYLLVLAEHIVYKTVFWICYPKKSGSISSDLILMKSWDIVFQSGYRGQTSVSIDDDWTGLRVTNAPKSVPTICDLPMNERRVEGIDFVNRKTQLPPDALAAVKGFDGLAECFYSLSFTTQKEYIMGIEDSKKEETRARRIGKMIGELQQKAMSLSGRKAKSK